MTQILVNGTIAPWLWNGTNYYQGQLIDPGLFGPSDSVLTGLPIQILWNSDPVVTAAIQINGTTVTLTQGAGYYAPYASVDLLYSGITVATFSPFNGLVDNIAINSYSPNSPYKPPNGLGGAFELIGPSASCNSGNFDPFVSSYIAGCDRSLDGYYFVSSMEYFAPPSAVPAPVIGEGLSAFVIAVLLGVYVCGCHRRRLSQPQ